MNHSRIASECSDIIAEHSRAVADLALRINEKRHLGLSPSQIEYAAMHHDIGVVHTDAKGIGCHGTEPYIRHGVIGADMLRRAGAPEWAARVAERHTGAGLTQADIINGNLPLPLDRVLVPETTLEKLICYADKFFSKRPGHLSDPKTIEKVLEEMAAHGPDTLARFNALHSLFS